MSTHIIAGFVKHKAYSVRRKLITEIRPVAAPRRPRFSHWRQAFLTGVAARRGFPGGGGAKGIRRRAGFLRTT